MESNGRRNFLKKATTLASVVALPRFATAERNDDGKVKIAIIGAGRSGRKAAKTLMRVDSDISVVAIADAFEDCATALRSELQDFATSLHSPNNKLFDVPNSRLFVGLNAYKDAIDCADIAILATPPVFRRAEIEYAVSKNKHFFAEKPICVDPVQARALRELAKLSKIKKLTCISGLQRRYHEGYREAIKRVHDGQIGEILFAQCQWFLPHFDGMELKTPPNADPNELEYQLRNWGLFAWTSGDHIVEQQVHNLDVMSWVFNRPPREVNAFGGRAVDLPMPEFGNRFSHFSADFDYGNNVHLFAACRQEPSTAHMVIERVVGTKGAMHTNLFTKQYIDGENAWVAPQSPDPAILQHKTLLKSVREGLGENSIDQMTDSAMLAISARISAYTGLRFKYAWAEKKSQESFEPKNLQLGKTPIAPLATPGKYRKV